MSGLKITVHRQGKPPATRSLVFGDEGSKRRKFEVTFPANELPAYPGLAGIRIAIDTVVDPAKKEAAPRGHYLGEATLAVYLNVHAPGVVPERQ